MRQISLSEALNFVKKHTIQLWIITVVALLASIISYAAYTSRKNVAERVIATSSDMDMKFSSNYLESGTTKVKAIIKENKNDTSLTVIIRNFSRNNPSVWYTSDINYDLTFSLTNTSGIKSTDTDYNDVMTALLGTKAVTVGGQTLNVSRMSYTFSGESLDYDPDQYATNSYTVTFPEVDSGICVRVVATPVPVGSYRDIEGISSILLITEETGSQGASWAGDFNDAQNLPFASYDAYNYKLSGHGSTNKATFSWNVSQLEMNKIYFSEKFNIDITDIYDDEDNPDGVVKETEKNGETWHTVTLSLNSVTSDRYDFQVYKADGFHCTTWNELINSITFDDGIE